MGLAVNTRLCHPASMTSTRRPTPSMRWLPLPWSEGMQNTASNRRSHPPCLQFRRPNECEYPWRLGDNTHNTWPCHILYRRWAQTKVLGYFAKRHLRLQWAKKVSVASSPSSTPPPPRSQKKKLSIRKSFPKKRECRSTPARHAANPYQPKRHPDAREKLKNYIFFKQNSNYNYHVV